MKEFVAQHFRTTARLWQLAPSSPCERDEEGSKLANAERAYDAVRRILEVASVGPVDRPVCESALSLERPDFEDGVIAAVALAEQCDVVISRDASAFGSLAAQRLSPSEFIKDRGYESLSISELLDEACEV